MSTRRYFFWCSICPTRITVETEVGATSADFSKPGYDFSTSEWVGSVRVREATEHDDGLEPADRCPSCGNPLDCLDDLLGRGLVPYHENKDAPTVHAAWLAKVKAGEKW